MNPDLASRSRWKGPDEYSFAQLDGGRLFDDCNGRVAIRLVQSAACVPPVLTMVRDG